MSYLRHMSPEARAELRRAKRIASEEDQARRTARAKDVLSSIAPGRRQPRERKPAFLSWLRACPCLACAIAGTPQTTRTEAAHVRRAYPDRGWRPVGGAEKPSDHRALPLCAWDHRTGPWAQHNDDSAAWYAERGIYPLTVCAALLDGHESDADPVEIIQTLAAECRVKMPGGF
jgi:hypothetical protein